MQLNMHRWDPRQRVVGEGRPSACRRSKAVVEPAFYISAANTCCYQGGHPFSATSAFDKHNNLTAGRYHSNGYRPAPSET